MKLNSKKWILDNKYICRSTTKVCKMISTCDRFLSYVSVSASRSPRSSNRSNVHCVSVRSLLRSALMAKSSIRISSTRRNVPSSKRMRAPRQKYAGAPRSGDEGGSWKIYNISLDDVFTLLDVSRFKSAHAVVENSNLHNLIAVKLQQCSDLFL